MCARLWLKFIARGYTLISKYPFLKLDTGIYLS